MATMAATHMPPNLEVPTADDDMEISSDAGRLEHYDDIDIDLMDPQDDDQEIDYMLDDDEQDHGRQDGVPDSSRDDVMVDDIEDTIVDEDILDDATIPNPQLLDVGDRYTDAALDQYARQESLELNDAEELEHTQDGLYTDVTQLNAQPLSHSEGLITNTHYEEDSANLPYDALAFAEPQQQEFTIASPPHTFEPETTALFEQNHEEQVSNTEKEQAQTPVQNEAQPGTDAPGSVASPQLQSVEDTGAEEPQLQDQHRAVDTDLGLPKVEVDKGVVPALSSEKFETISYEESSDSTAIANADSAPLPQETATSSEQTLQQPSPWNDPDRTLHPVTVEYASTHMSLFPPLEDDQGTYLLQDASVAEKTMNDFFRECRKVLGESIDDNDELEVYCEELDLYITEDSIHCANTSFSQIIDIYVTLMRHDGVEDPSPLFITLTAKPRFSSRLETLFRAAGECKGLSQVQSDYTSPTDDINADTDEQNKQEQEIHEQPQAEAANDQENEPAEPEHDVAHPDQPQDSGELAQAAQDQPVDGEHEAEFDLEEYPEDFAGAAGDDNNQTGEYFADPEPAAHEKHNTYGETSFAEASDTADKHEHIHRHDDTLADGGADEGYVESSGSSTVQGEHDAAPTYTASGDSSEPLPSLPGDDGHESAIKRSGEGVLANEDGSAGEAHQYFHEHTEGDEPSGETQSHVSEEPVYDLDAANQEWDPASYEDEGDHFHDEAQYDDGNHSPENSWGTLGNQAEPKYNDMLTATAVSVGVRPDTALEAIQESAEEDEEDSISYDDDLDEVVEPTPVASQGQPSVSPPGKRAREEDHEDGGDDGSDQESKRLRSH